MKKFLNKYRLTLLATISYIVVLSALFCFKVEKIEIYISCFAIITSLYFGLLKHQLSNDELFYKLFKDFNERYDSRLNDLLNDIRNKPDTTLNDIEKNLVIDYFNLCAEEYLWYKKGRLPKDIWEAWSLGISENLKIEQVYHIYQAEMKTGNGRKAYYGLEDKLKKIDSTKQ